MPDGSIPIEQTRDFKTVDEMNEAIVNNINKVVGQYDVLYHLGDWSFGGFDNVKIFWDRLICKNIYLLIGNHDHHIENDRDNCQELFKSVQHYLTIKVDNYTIKALHYPISSWDGLKKGYIHLHGHCHLPQNLRFGNGKRMDVGMDGHPEFRPYNFRREIAPLMNKREIASDMMNDHHTDTIIT
jgi:calcineurin-like phosphoesterase family protein